MAKRGVNIQPVLLDIDGIYELLGGTIGRNSIQKMMKDGEFEIVRVGKKNKLVATTKSVLQKVESWMQTKQTCGDIDFLPNKFFIDFTKNI